MRDEQIFVDTNILVYAHDQDARKKHLLARSKIEELWHKELLPAISVQVLQEFYVNLTKRKVAFQQARETVENYFVWDVIDNDKRLFQESLQLQEKYKLSYWDSLILAAAKMAKAAILWSEDFNEGQIYEGIKVVNPLRGS